MCSQLLRAEGLRREFGRERFAAVKDVSLEVSASQIHGLLGPNGAGKTTVVRMCATLLAPTAGKITVHGVDAVRYPERARAQIGLVLGGELGFYPRASARDNLLFFADLCGVSGRRRKHVVSEALERVGLADVGERKAGQFSRGMLQRLHLARALLGEPTLLLLDEPTTGLDPDVALRVRDIIRELAKQGAGILLTSHSMPEVEELADSISLIGAGAIATRGTVGDIARYAGVDAVSTFTVPAHAAGIGEELSAALGHKATVEQRSAAGRWLVTIYWAQGVNVAGELDAVHKIVAVTAGSATNDAITRPASLQEAYLAVADRLAR